MKGTQAHAFITSFTPEELPRVDKLRPKDSNQEPRDFYPVVCDWLKKVAPVLRVLESEVHMGELAAFSAYAVAFPNIFLALVDTYDVYRYVVELVNLMLKIASGLSKRAGSWPKLPASSPSLASYFHLLLP